MAFFDVKLKETYLSWGSYRYTKSRETIYGEGYLPIPADFAKNNNIYNSNNNRTGIGFNKFNFSTDDKFITDGILKASGCSCAGDIHAKNLHVSGNLKGLGSWFAHINAKVGDIIRVDFISPTYVKLTKL
ncbi:MAG: hypothetical protein RSD40_05630 [Bacilli bacterium]|uniref:hypothetical protein n=1 Tax=Cetobacterium sp. TaxID=2071632 RepID=UPI002FCC7561